MAATIKVPEGLRDRINRDARERGMTAERLFDSVGVVGAATMHEVDGWLRDFLGLP